MEDAKINRRQWYGSCGGVGLLPSIPLVTLRCVFMFKHVQGVHQAAGELASGNPNAVVSFSLPFVSGLVIHACLAINIPYF